MKKIKLKLIKLYYKYFNFISVKWYAFTMHITRKKYYLKKAKYIIDIPEKFKYGTLYTKDPFNGKLDYLAHPSRLEYRLDSGLDFGDCDDHAIYSATVLKKSKLADRVWFSYYTMLKERSNHLSGHAVCVFEKNGEYYWSDYRIPNKISGKNKWGWAIESASIYHSKPIAAAMIEIESVDSFDTPVFGSREVVINFDQIRIA
tara:strand:+ start:644 stop:1249 length:606 start_codon:yes stop_codon:yes gene_type:complete